MTDELLQSTAAARTHVEEAWGPVVIDESTLADWAKLPESEPSPQPDEQEPNH